MLTLRRQRDRVRERADHQARRSAQLHLNGNDAFIEDSTALGSNSALTGLASIGAGAMFDLENGASVSTGALVNHGSISLIASARPARSSMTETSDLDADGGDGGSSLTVGGR